MTRAAIYCRISNDPSGRAAGVDRQEQECRELVRSRSGWEATEPAFTDNDVKATARKRPQFTALMKAIENGQVDAVVAWKDDRLLRGGRSKWAHEFLTLIRDRLVPVSFVQGQDWDFSTAQGRLLVEVRLSIAAYEIEQAGERQEARWRQRKRDGKPVTLGRRPFGLLPVDADGRPIPKGSKDVRINHYVEVPEEAEAIRRAARQLIEGESLYAVTRDLGVPTPYGGAWRPQHFKRALLSDHLVRYGVLGADEHLLVVARLGQPKNSRKPGRPNREYALSGLVTCGVCGSKMGASSGAYHCQQTGCGKVGVQVKYLEPLVLGQMGEHLPPEPTPGEPVAAKADDAPVLRELAAIEERIEALADNVELSEVVLARRTRALEAKRDELMARLGRTQSREQWPPAWFRRWVTAGMPTLPTDEDSREFLRELIDRVVVDPAPVRGRKRFDPSRVQVAWREPS